MEFRKEKCENIEEQIKENWKTLPLTENLKEIMNMETCDDKECLNPLEKYNIPEIKEGYYYFLDRHQETTKSTMHSADKNKLAGVGQNIINHRERLLNLQKRQKLKDLLITKFMQKYGINNPEEILEDEITKLLQGEKLNDMDLKRLDQKVKNILKEKASKERLKNSLTQSLQENTLNQPANLTTETQKTSEPKLINNQPRIVTTEPSVNTVDKPKLSSSHYNPYNTYCNKRSRIIYKNPEEELAELEAEFAKEEELKNKNYERLDFTSEGDEWSAMAKYNRKLYEEQIQEEKLKNLNQKRLNKRDLDLQIKQRLKREYEDELKEKEYDRIIEEHQKKMDELDRQKQEEIKKQIKYTKKNVVMIVKS